MVREEIQIEGRTVIKFLGNFLKDAFINLFRAEPDLHCYAGFSVVAASRCYCLWFTNFSLQGLLLFPSAALGHVGSVVAAPRLENRLNSCGARVYFLGSMCDPPSPGIEPMSPALTDGFLPLSLQGSPLGHF